ncbi:G5 domain-containing protein [Spirillospora sp. NPDC048911]|uniref:G5 domain-containing protein n=1 Tax=Spirillospora sp. NPDC048911 TaxID=3364527 RepID=UPI00370FD50A
MKRATVAILAISGLFTVGAKCGGATEAGPPAPTATSTASSAPASAAVKATPSSETRTVTETKSIPYKTRRIQDPSLAEGVTKVRTRGVAGVKTLTFHVTSVNGAEVTRKLIREVVSKRPITQVIVVGTKQASKCDPNYSGACVPIASDVDCAGGSGNGPAYVDGPVRVVGSDIYDLDRDGDGIACDT